MVRKRNEEYWSWEIYLVPDHRRDSLTTTQLTLRLPDWHVFIENRCSFLLESGLASPQETKNGKFLNGCQALQEEDAEESLDGLGARDTRDRHSRTRWDLKIVTGKGRLKERGMFTWRSLNIGPSWVRFSVEFYEKLSLFGPEYRMWRVRPGSAALIQWKNWGSWRTLKKSPGSASVRRQVSDLWMPYGGLTKEESKGDAKGQVTKSHPLKDSTGWECHICFWVLSIKCSQKCGITLK